MLETVDGSGSGGVFVDENQASCGSILATGNLHLSPIGAVLQQARKPKPAAGERPAIAGARSPKIWDAPQGSKLLSLAGRRAMIGTEDQRGTNFRKDFSVSKLLKVGVVGVGGISKAHMPGWAASEQAEVIAGSDISAQSLEKWGARYGVSRLVSDPAELFKDPDIDIIDVCTPNRYHAPLAIAALNAGKHVLCEKPLAPTPAEIRQMIEARDRSGKLLMTAQHYRFRGDSQALKAELSTGVLGEIYHARSWMLRRALLPVRPGFIYEKHSGGGPTIDVGVHILDLALWLMDSPQPVAVSGVAKAPLAKREGAFSAWGLDLVPQDMDVEDFAAAFVRFENGATLILETSWLLHHDAMDEDPHIWLYGTEGGCHWPTTKILETNYKTRQFYNRFLQLTQDKMEPHALECVAFAQAVAEGAPSPVPAEQSLQVQAILDGVYRSQAEGREVRIAA